MDRRSQEEPAQAAAPETGGRFGTTAEAAVIIALAAALLVGTTYLHGRMTDRWTGLSVSDDLHRAADLLETRFPNRFGEWEIESELDFDPLERERAGAVGHVSRLYANRRTKAKVTVFVVCATPRDASGHTPDRCYPGAGFEIAEAEHREKVVLADGRSAEVFVGTFRKSGQTLRVYWTYGVEGSWVAPHIARIELADAKAVYKLYAIIDETSLPQGVGSRVCVDFLTRLLPDFDAAVGGDGRSEGRDDMSRILPRTNLQDVVLAALKPA